MKPSAFTYLNITQFLGVLNDNLFKLLLVFMLIHLQGPKESGTILSFAGAVFVIPFLILSIPAGTLADRYSKKKIILGIKGIEIVASLFGVFAFYHENSFGLYFALFVLAISGAIFGPTKYGIVPELVPQEKLSKSNGLLSSFTFLAIIIGTSAAGPLTELTDKNFFIASFVCLFLSIVGMYTAFHIPNTLPAGSEKVITPLFFLEIFETLKSAFEIKHLLVAIFGSAFFLFVGGFVQLNIIPYAMFCLKLTDVQGSYLFLITAFGIGIGSLLAGKLSGDTVKIGLSAFGALGMALSFFILSTCGMNLYFVCTALFMIGFFGGIYLVPLDSFIQYASPPNERGQNVAANNFMGFVGVLLASFLLYFLGHMLKLPPQSGFTTMAFLTLLMTIALFLLLRNPVKSLFTKKAQP